MSDTVRDAVFGNVGTMICFRVSADDAPILSKQFEPNFEALDLLQMHNRNFVINMVINGEKTPAFSARTLNLPPTQADNTGRIVEHTRLNYSRERSEVEKEIADLVNSTAAVPMAKPPAPAGATWPINAHTQVITPAQSPQVSSSDAAPAKKKRTNALVAAKRNRAQLPLRQHNQSQSQLKALCQPVAAPR